MKAVFPLLGWAFFLFCIAHFVSGFGSRWECGRYCMPKTLIAADGHSYPDGTSIPAPILALARSGVEEDLMLGMLVVLGGSLMYLASAVHKFHRSAREYREMFGRDFKCS